MTTNIADIIEEATEFKYTVDIEEIQADKERIKDIGKRSITIFSVDCKTRKITKTNKDNLLKTLCLLG